MPVRINVQTTRNFAAPIRELSKGTSRKLLRKIARDVLPPLSRAFDRTVRRYPPPRNPNTTFVWSRDPAANARARRWFFANYPNGYTRTGDLGKAWETDLYLAGDDVFIEVQNDSRGASYVYGSEDYGQVPGHVTTGWEPITGTIAEYAELVDERLEEVWVEFLGDALIIE